MRINNAKRHRRAHEKHLCGIVLTRRMNRQYNNTPWHMFLMICEEQLTVAYWVTSNHCEITVFCLCLYYTAPQWPGLALGTNWPWFTNYAWILISHVNLYSVPHINYNFRTMEKLLTLKNVHLTMQFGGSKLKWRLSSKCSLSGHFSLPSMIVYTFSNIKRYVHE